MDVRRPETIGDAATAGHCCSGRSPRGCWQIEATAAFGSRRRFAGRCVDGDALASVARLESQQSRTYHARWTFVGPWASQTMK
jgi:hypothetical protein